MTAIVLVVGKTVITFQKSVFEKLSLKKVGKCQKLYAGGFY